MNGDTFPRKIFVTLVITAIVGILTFFATFYVYAQKLEFERGYFERNEYLHACTIDLIIEIIETRGAPEVLQDDCTDPEIVERVQRAIEESREERPR